MGKRKVLNSIKTIYEKRIEVTIETQNGNIYKGRITKLHNRGKRKLLRGAGIYFRCYTGKVVYISLRDISDWYQEPWGDERLEQVTSVEATKRWFENHIVTGKKIIGIRMLADDIYLNVHTFATWYVNSSDFDGHYVGAVSREKINDSDLRTRGIATEGPIIIEFEDGSNLAFEMSNQSVFRFKENFEGIYDGAGPNTDIGKMFANIIGRKIVSTKCNPLGVDSQSIKMGWVDLNIAPKDWIKSVELNLDDGKFILISDGYISLMKGRNNPDNITMGEYIEMLPNSQRYFIK